MMKQKKKVKFRTTLVIWKRKSVTEKWNQSLKEKERDVMAWASSSPSRPLMIIKNKVKFELMFWKRKPWNIAIFVITNQICNRLKRMNFEDVVWERIIFWTQSLEVNKTKRWCMRFKNLLESSSDTRKHVKQVKFAVIKKWKNITFCVTVNLPWWEAQFREFLRFDHQSRGSHRCCSARKWPLCMRVGRIRNRWQKPILTDSWMKTKKWSDEAIKSSKKTIK